MIKMFDASVPPEKAPAGYEVAAGYIGGDTPHVWTTGEWDRFQHLKRLPIWTRSNPSRTLAWPDAWSILQRLFALGVPKGATVALDLETAIDQEYVNRVCEIVIWAGYSVWLYGSSSRLLRYTLPPGPVGYWVAEYQPGRQPYMYDHPHVVATQYTDGPAYDRSTVRPWQYEHKLW